MSSRLLILALTVVAVASSAASLYLGGPEALRHAHNQLDGQLGRAARALPAVLAGGAQQGLGLAAEVAATSRLADSLAASQKPDEAMLQGALSALQARAEKRGDAEKSAMVVLASSRGVAEFRREGGNVFGSESAVPLVGEALSGARVHSLATVDDGYYRVAAVPVEGAAGPVGALAVGYAVDDAFVTHLRELLGVDVSVMRKGSIVASSLGATDRTRLVEAVGSGTPASFGFGRLPADTFSLFEILPLPLFADGAHANRARSVKLTGLEGAEVVLSTPAVASLAPIADGDKRGLLFSGAILVLGLLFALLARSRPATSDNEDLETLADAAERAASGDASAKAAEYLPRELGRIARAVNKLSARARAVPQPTGSSVHSLEHTPEPPADVADQFPFGGPRPEGTPAPAARVEATPAPREPTPAPRELTPAPREATPAPAALQPPPPPTPTPSFARAIPPPPPAAVEPPPPPPAPAAETSEPGDFAWSRGPVPDPVAPPPPPPPSPSNRWEMSAPAARSQTIGWDTPSQVGGAAPDAFAEAMGSSVGKEEFNPDATMVATVPEALLRATSRAPEPQRPAVDPEEAHFQQVYREFLATRQRCGEPAANLPYERFAAKLRSNREQLMAKYQCRTVRFTVYVKEGKAALKASPVKS